MKRKKELVIIGLIIIFLIIILLLRLYINSVKGLKTITVSNITYKYNTFWNLENKNNDKISLSHQNGSNMNLYIKKLDNNNLSLNEISKLIVNNYDYTKITNIDKKVINENNYEGQNILLENNDEEILLTIFKKGEYVIINEYISSLNNYDFLIDSVLTSNYYLKIKDV